MRRVRLRPALLGYAMVAMTLVAGCASAGSTSTHQSPQPVVLVEHDASTGKTVHVRVGDRIALILASQYWIIRGSSTPAVLRQEGPTTTLAPPPGNCPAGVGCRPLRTLFAALTPGTAVITAHRGVCGEALRCVGSQGDFRLTVVVQQK